jgi:putative oxidoreductase
MTYIGALGRIIFGLFFIMAGAGKFANPQAALLVIEQTGIIYADKIVWGIAAIELAGGAALFFGFATRLAAFLTAASVIFVAVLLNNFWVLPDPLASQQFIGFTRAMTTVAGLMLLMSFGPGPLSVDANE